MKRLMILGLMFMLVLSFSAYAVDVDEVNAAIAAAGADWQAGHTSVSRLSVAEMLMMTGKMQTSHSPFESQGGYSSQAGPYTYPSAHDWRNASWDTPIKDEGLCAASWAFSAVGVLESRINIALDDPAYDMNLSEQFVITYEPSGNCSDGGFEGHALEFMENYGTVTEECFPFDESDVPAYLPCGTWADEIVKILNYSLIEPNAADIKQAIWEYGPVTAYVQVYDDFFAYTSGIYTQVNGSTNGWHAIVLEGWNDTGNYWIARNSWGAYWGEEGYFRIAYSEQEEDCLIWNGSTQGVLCLDDSYVVTMTDIDGDLVDDAVDNCPFLNNSDQADIDMNGVGDACDCLPIWVEDNNNCTASDLKLISFTDINTCDKTFNLSATNGTFLACDYCTPSWWAYNTTCREGDQLFTFYNDSFMCYNITGLASDNNPPANLSYGCNFFPELMITEVMYNPDGFDHNREWVEVYNADDFSIDLFSIDFYESFKFYPLSLVAGNWSLQPGEYAVISDDSSLFLIDYPTYGQALFEAFFGSLQNSGEQLALFEGTTLLDGVRYYDTWGSLSGYSLSLINLTLDNNESSNWRLSYWEGGTPGLRNDCVANWVELNTSCNSDVITGWYNDTNDCYFWTDLDEFSSGPANNSYVCDDDIIAPQILNFTWSSPVIAWDNTTFWVDAFDSTLLGKTYVGYACDSDNVTIKSVKYIHENTTRELVVDVIIPQDKQNCRGGNLTVRVEVMDADNDSYNDTLSVIQYYKLLVQNTAPVLSYVSPGGSVVNIFEGNTTLFNVTAADGENDTLAYSWFRNGTLMGSLSYLNYTAAYGEVEVWNISVLVDDGLLNVSRSWILNVNNVDDLPVWTAIGNYTINEDNNLSVMVSAYDPDGMNITYSVNDTAFTVNNSGWLFYSPVTNWNGVRSVIVTASDGTLSTPFESVVTVLSVNDAPYYDLGSGWFPNQVFAEEASRNFIDLYDPDQFIDVDNPYNLTFSYFSMSDIVISIDNATGIVTFTAPVDYFGTQTTYFTAMDPHGLTGDSNWFNITVTNVNDAPVLSAVGDRVINEDTLFTLQLVGTDVDGDNLTYTTNSTVVNVSSSGLIAFLPDQPEVGEHNVRISVSDGMLTDYEDVVFTVLNVNDAPVWSAIPPINFNEDSYLSGFDFTLYVTDVDNNISSLQWAVSVSPYVDVNINANGIANITSTPDYFGMETIHIEADDGQAYATGRVNITVNPMPDAPVLSAIGNLTAYEDIAFTYQLTALDIDGDNLTFTSNDALVTVSSSGLISFTPTDSDVGVRTVRFTVSDSVLSDFEDVIFTVVGVNDPPVLNPIADINVTEGQIVTIVASGTDPESDPLTFNFSSPFNGAGQWQTGYNDAGAYNVLVTVNDGNGGSDSQSVLVTVHNDADQDGIPDYLDNDDDNDGIPDTIDLVMGDMSYVQTSLPGLLMTIDGANPFTQTQSGWRFIQIYSNTELLLEFWYNFGVLDLRTMSIFRDAGTDGNLEVSGLSASNKTMYIQNLNTAYSQVCIIDQPSVNYSDFTTSCNSANEVLIGCDGNLSNGYTCTDIGTHYRITGLQHSGAKEGSCTESWTCGDWGSCGGTQSRSCTDANNCGTQLTMPALTQVCVPDIAFYRTSDRSAGKRYSSRVYNVPPTLDEIPSYNQEVKKSVVSVPKEITAPLAPVVKTREGSSMLLFLSVLAFAVILILAIIFVILTQA